MYDSPNLPLEQPGSKSVGEYGMAPADAISPHAGYVECSADEALPTPDDLPPVQETGAAALGQSVEYDGVEPPIANDAPQDPPELPPGDGEMSGEDDPSRKPAWMPDFAAVHDGTQPPVPVEEQTYVGAAFETLVDDVLLNRLEDTWHYRYLESNSLTVETDVDGEGVCWTIGIYVNTPPDSEGVVETPDESLEPTAADDFGDYLEPDPPEVVALKEIWVNRSKDGELLPGSLNYRLGTDGTVRRYTATPERHQEQKEQLAAHVERREADRSMTEQGLDPLYGHQYEENLTRAQYVAERAALLQDIAARRQFAHITAAEQAGLSNLVARAIEETRRRP